MRVIFYEKPHCANNARQKQMLARAGHTVISRNLLSEPWTAERLGKFFGNTPVSGWFNRASPRIKSGEINPDNIDAATAFTLMLADPLLIRRPLMEIEGEYLAGFETGKLALWLGLNLSGNAGQDWRRCIRAEKETLCKEELPS